MPNTEEKPLRYQALDVRDGRRHAPHRESRGAPLLEVRDGIRVLAAESDYDAYCFYVAGTVGHMATELVVDHYRLADDVATKLEAACEAWVAACRKPTS